MSRLNLEQIIDESIKKIQERENFHSEDFHLNIALDILGTIYKFSRNNQVTADCYMLLNSKNNVELTLNIVKNILIHNLSIYDALREFFEEHTPSFSLDSIKSEERIKQCILRSFLNIHSHVKFTEDAIIKSSIEAENNLKEYISKSIEEVLPFILKDILEAHFWK